MLKDAHERGSIVVQRTSSRSQDVHCSPTQLIQLQNHPSPWPDILKRATDVVYSEVDAGGIELHSTALDGRGQLGTNGSIS